MKNQATASIAHRAIVFVDSAVQEFESLLEGLIADVSVVILQPDRDGIAQITEHLHETQQIDRIHIVSHGKPGQLQLGNASLSLTSLTQYQGMLRRWRSALSENAAVLLYGCQVAQESGTQFIHRLKRIVGAEVAASSTLIGNAALGGNWHLDVTTGDIAPSDVFAADRLAVYPAVLVNTFLDEDFSDASGSTPPAGWQNVVIEGDAAVDQWRFDNPGDRSFPDAFASPAATFDSDNVSNNDLKENVALVSPTFDASGAAQVFLQLDQNYLGLIDPDYGSEAFIEVYNGTSWQVVADQLRDTIGTTRIDISSAAAGVSNAQVRFRYTGNWSYYWSLDNVKVVDALTPGVTKTADPQVSEDKVPDTRNFQFVLNSKPTSDVTLNFAVDTTQLNAITSLTFTPENWNISQTATVSAIADGVKEGNQQTSPITISIASSDANYSGLTLPTAIASITDNAIPGFLSYRTVEKTYADLETLATKNSSIARWLDIGDSYDKLTPGGAEGYDIHVLELTNRNSNPEGGKPVLYVEGGLHAREYSTNEVATRFGEYLVNSYGINPDVTWLLDYFQIDINPVANPDGRKFAEQGYLWRKNTNPTPPPGFEAAEFPDYGVDLNRNYAFEWGEVEGGSSGDPISDTYRGSAPASEPEVQAVQQFAQTLFPDQRGPNRADPAPQDATGVFVDLHSFGNTVLYPWGSTAELAPNREALRNLGLKFGYYTDTNGTPYDVYQSIGLYPTDGTADDWAYGTLGVAAYTWELGTDFLEPSDYFEASIAPQVIPALLYAAKSAYRPYKTSAAPEAIQIEARLPQVVQGTVANIALKATADDTRYADSNNEGLDEGKDLPAPANIRAARYSIDAPSWIAGTKTYRMDAADGQFDSPVEQLIANIDTTNLAPGRHTIFVESKDESSAYGVPTAIFLDVLEAPLNANVTRGGSGADAITTTGNRNDVVYTFLGQDVIKTNAGSDTVLAGKGNDTAEGGAGDDLLYGGDGDDILRGGAGQDKLYGEAGNDTLIGQQGDDLLRGGKGDDLVRGGAGKDTFALAFEEGRDLIQDFEVGTDLIGLVGTLTFNQLSISQDATSTLISLGQTVLAELADVAANSLTRSSFVGLSAVA